MLHSDFRKELEQLTADLRRASGPAAHPAIGDLGLMEIDALRPTELISTAEVAEKYRYLPAFGGGKTRYLPSKTPYMREIHDAFDDVTVRIILVKGNARSGKTTGPENALLKIAKFGPARGMLWYQQSEPDLRRYVEERLDFFFREHDGLEEKLGKRGGRQKWNLKQVDGMPWEWLPANPSTTRQRSAAFIVADEVDAMRPAIGNAILTLIRNRQREYGSLAKACVMSHPDRGPLAGIDQLLVESDRRLRYWTCPDCAHLISPCVEAGRERRVTWNVPELIKAAGEDVDRDELIDFVEANVFLVCPHCKGKITNEQRLELDQDGIWIGKGQVIDEHENVAGQRIRTDTVGFVIHAFMTPFVTLGGLAREWVGAWLTFHETGDDALLKEVSVKSLGETYEDPDDPAAQRKEWKEVKAAHLDTGYKLGTVPRGVDFLTMMVDVQGNRFEAGVWGWSRNRECWLVDRFAFKQLLGLEDIAPAEKLEHWDVLERALAMTYPLVADPQLHLGIAKMAVDTGGEPGVTNNARIWAANLLAAGKTEAWRLMLSKGDRHLQGELYGRVNQIKVDDGGRPLPVTVNERIVNVSAVKRVMARRLAIPNPGPGFVHLPADIEDRHVKELVAETFVNGEWISHGRRNETWDTLIMCEVARALLAPETAAIDWVNDPPPFAVPFVPSQSEDEDDNKPVGGDFFDRLARLNRGPRE